MQRPVVDAHEAVRRPATGPWDHRTRHGIARAVAQRVGAAVGDRVEHTKDRVWRTVYATVRARGSASGHAQALGASLGVGQGHPSRARRPEAAIDAESGRRAAPPLVSALRLGQKIPESRFKVGCAT